MTESEAREMLQAKLICIEKESKPIYSEEGCDRNCDGCNYCYAQGTMGEQKQALSMAIKALEKQSMVNEILHELKEYSLIGTVEEFKALKEKQIAKKPCVGNDEQDDITCPHCKGILGFVDCWQLHSYNKHCPTCGQKLDWAEMQKG